MELQGSVTNVSHGDWHPRRHMFSVGRRLAALGGSLRACPPHSEEIAMSKSTRAQLPSTFSGAIRLRVHTLIGLLVCAVARVGTDDQRKKHLLVREGRVPAHKVCVRTIRDWKTGATRGLCVTEFPRSLVQDQREAAPETERSPSRTARQASRLPCRVPSSSAPPLQIGLSGRWRAIKLAHGLVPSCWRGLTRITEFCTPLQVGYSDG